jgi:hypothetical protein
MKDDSYLGTKEVESHLDEEGEPVKRDVLTKAEEKRWALTNAGKVYANFLSYQERIKYLVVEKAGLE